MDYLDKCAKLYVNSKKPSIRKIGRFNSSELCSIIDYRLTPEKWFHSPPKDLRGAKNISWGLYAEKMLAKWFEAGERKFRMYGHEDKDRPIYKINDEIDIVVLPDFEFEDRVLECKCCEEMPDSIKSSNIYQLEIQSRIFNKPIYIVYLGRKDHKIFRYKQSDKTLKVIEDGIKKFHNKIIEYEKK